jgi:predicted dienelactone hydrolase
MRWIDARGKALTAEVWYPAEVEPGSTGDDYGQISAVGIAHRDAVSDLRWAPYPLIAFSHGFGGIRYQSTFLTEHLASHGFVVIAPDHPDNTLFDLDQSAATRVAIERPGDVSSAVDRMHEVSENEWFGLGGLVDPAAGFGMSGHSFGGWTAVGVAGARFDPKFFAAHCEEFDEAACDFIGDLSEIPGLVPPDPDPRVVASVAMAPGAWYAYGEEGLRNVVQPLILGGDLDRDMPYEREIRALYDHLGESRALLTVHGAGHWGFSDLCETLSLDVFADCAGESGGFVDPAVTAAITNEAVTAHFQVHVRGEERAASSLGSRWDEHPDATWED